MYCESSQNSSSLKNPTHFPLTKRKSPEISSSRTQHTVLNQKKQNNKNTNKKVQFLTKFSKKKINSGIRGSCVEDQYFASQGDAVRDTQLRTETQAAPAMATTFTIATKLLKTPFTQRRERDGTRRTVVPYLLPSR
jgi:hypothetical protein